MLKSSLFLTLVLFLAVPVVAQNVIKEFLPAGTLLTCTMSEPNFSSKTVQTGDPVLCHLAQVSSFGHPVFPRGAYLTGHLEDSKSPGHFVGKGWLEVAFDRIILPGPQIFTLSAKVISTPHYKVDKDGKVHGRGHAVRDSVEWALPPLWPMKVILLPRRGPYPTFKGETRLTMRLMEDVEIPQLASNVPMPPWSSERSSSYLQPGPRVWQDEAQPVAARNYYPQSSQSQVQVQSAAYTWTSPSRITPAPSAAQPTLLVLKDSSAYLAQSYWIENDKLHCVSQNAKDRYIPLEMVDLAETVRLNHERNLDFNLRSRPLASSSADNGSEATQITQH